MWQDFPATFGGLTGANLDSDCLGVISTIRRHPQSIPELPNPAFTLSLLGTKTLQINKGKKRATRSG